MQSLNFLKKLFQNIYFTLKNSPYILNDTHFEINM